MIKNKRIRWKLWIPLALFVYLVGYTIYAGHLVSEKMSSLQWELPSRIYGTPIVYYPGTQEPIEIFQHRLDRLGYQKVTAGKIVVGQWKKTGNEVEVWFRKFQDFSGDYPSSHVRFQFSANQVAKIYSLNSDSPQEMGTLLLEPQKIGEIYPSQREQRTIVRIDDTPRMLKSAIMVMEDRKFYQHHGVSFTGIARALLRNLSGGHVAQGGSTLTQQLMKNFFLSPERTVTRKLKELVMTVLVELLYSKDEIFEAYLNEIYLGQRGATSVNGFGEASRFYFAKDLNQTTLSEQALLAGMISSPGKFSPYNHIEAAYERRNIVLNALYEQNYLSKQQLLAAKSEKIQPRGERLEYRIAPYFIDELVKEVGTQYSEVSLRKEGLNIYSTLDPLLQEFAEQAVEKGMKDLGKNGEGLEAALLAIHPKTGVVKAFVGGRNYSVSQFNRVTQMRRPVGSLIKPFIAATVLSPQQEKEPPTATLATVLEDRPSTFSFEGQDWSPKNYDSKYFGSVTLRGAIENSLNVATINMASLIPFSSLVDGVRKFEFENIQALPSLTLGAVSSSPWEIARAYSSFPNSGTLSFLRSVSGVVSRGGERTAPKTFESHEVLSPEVAYLVIQAMTGVVERGTARRIPASGIFIPVAGKTGTTDDNRDAWFVGFTPSLLTVVWVGYDDNQQTGLTGSSGALPIWINFMKSAQKTLLSEMFVVPPDIEWFEIDRQKGCKGGSGERIREAFLKGTEPPKCQ